MLIGTDYNFFIFILEFVCNKFVIGYLIRAAGIRYAIHFTNKYTPIWWRYFEE